MTGHFLFTLYKLANNISTAKYLSPAPPKSPVEIYLEDNGGLENITGQSQSTLSKLSELNPHDVLTDVNTFISETWNSTTLQLTQLYNKHAPPVVTIQVDKAYTYFHSDKIWPHYVKYQKPIHNLLIGIAILILLRLFSAIIKLLTPKPREQVQEVPKITFTEQDFETIPLCVGKGDAEELLLFNSYSEILKSSNDEDLFKRLGIDNSDTNSIARSDLSVLDNFSPTRYGSPNDYTASDISAIFQTTKQGVDPETPIEVDFKGEDSFSSSQGEDSFEREENLVDSKLENLNSTSMVVSHSSANSLDQYSTSPSKKLIYKKTSVSILSNGAFPRASVADTTVGNITEETVYSEPFAGDANASFENSL